MKNQTIHVLASCLALAGVACKPASRGDQRSQDTQAQPKQPEQAQAQPAQAQPPQAQPPTAMPQQQPAEQGAASQTKQNTVSGSVSQVGASDITVGQPGGESVHVFVDSTVPVTLDGQKASLSEIPTGATALVVFSMQGDQQKAQRIDAQTRQPVRGTEGNDQQQKEQQPNDQRPNDQPPNDHEQP